MKKNTSSAYIISKDKANIIKRPDMQFPNGSNVFHILNINLCEL